MRVKTEERRQAIIEVAREAFTAQGFENTSMAEIASRVGGSKATLYNYFSSKEELFAAVIDEFGGTSVASARTISSPRPSRAEQLPRPCSTLSLPDRSVPLGRSTRMPTLTRSYQTATRHTMP